MSEQPAIKPRTIKTEISKPPVIDNNMIAAQYNALMQHMLNMEQQLDYLIAQPREKTVTKQETERQSAEPKKVTSLWEKEPRQMPPVVPKESPRTEPKKKRNWLPIVALAILAVLITVYLIWSRAQGYVPFWEVL